MPTSTGYTPRETLDTVNFSQPLNLMYLTNPKAGDVDCTGKTDLLAWPQMSQPLLDVVLLNRLKPGDLTMCLMANGTTAVGELPLALCKRIYTYCQWESETECRACKRDDNCKNNGTRWHHDCRFNASYRLPLKGDTQTETFCVKTAPGIKGTIVLADWYFLCGHKAYLSLPEKWGGLCALVSCLTTSSSWTGLSITRATDISVKWK